MPRSALGDFGDAVILDRTQTGNAALALPITVRELTKTYGSFVALDDVSLDVASGEFLTLLGPSGSGKTTLLMVLAGFIRPDSGRVMFGDRDVSLVPPHKRDVGMVFQNYALFPNMTVAGNLAYPLKLRSVGRAEIEEKVRRALDMVQLSGLDDRNIDQLSGGQRQRVAVARAIIFEPRILLMDEPLSALDKKLREQMQIEVRHLHQRLGMTTVYVTHDQREALTMSDRIAVIDRGRFRQIGSPRDIYERPANRFIADFIGESTFLPVDVRNGEAFLGAERLDLAATLPATSTAQVLVLRPEKIKLLDGSETGRFNRLRGTVREIVYQGESTLVYVETATGVEVAVRRIAGGGSSVPDVGAEVTIGFVPEDTVIISADVA